MAKDKKDRHYLTSKEIKAIVKENNKVIRVLEKKKKRKAPESEFTSEMKDPAHILEVEDLNTYFFTDQGVVKAVNGVSFEIPQGSTVGVVGESGCGKSVTSMSVMRLLQGPYGQIVSGNIRFKSYDFKRDAKGKPIPVWENDENGEPIYDPAYKDGKLHVAETDENGEPIMEEVLDEAGRPVLGEGGEPAKAYHYSKDEKKGLTWRLAFTISSYLPGALLGLFSILLLVFLALPAISSSALSEGSVNFYQLLSKIEGAHQDISPILEEYFLQAFGLIIFGVLGMLITGALIAVVTMIPPEKFANGKDPVIYYNLLTLLPCLLVLFVILSMRGAISTDASTLREDITFEAGNAITGLIALSASVSAMIVVVQIIHIFLYRQYRKFCFVHERVIKTGKDGKPVLERRQKRDQYGTRQFEMEEKVFDIAEMPTKEMYRLRGRQIAMIFQEPMTSLNPVFTIGNQRDEVTLLHFPGSSREEAKQRSIEMLNLVGIAAPDRVYKSYPHELSGGMRQRVMISMALAGDPRLIIADEPTTALDVTIQAQILDLLRDLKKRINGSILLITHDLGIIAEMADYVVVMYAGRIIEKGTASEIFHNPMHPYTIGLQKSKPTMDSNSDTLFNIPGNVPNPIDMPDYCYFRERCSGCVKACFGDYPPMVQVSPTHFVACHLYNKEKTE